MNRIYFGDNLPVLKGLAGETVDLIYIDPPFNTGRSQTRATIKTVRSERGDRKGFQGKSYETRLLDTKSYADSFDDYLDGFLRPRLEEAHRLLKPYGSLYFHIDYREVHYCKILLDEIFGRDCFLNEIIWAYDYGARAKSKWPPKHDNILYYAKDPKNYIFNPDQIDREQYIAPGLVGPAKAERGKLPTDTWWFSYVGRRPSDTWWQTIVPTNGRERVGYPTQKPRKLIDRIVKASSHPGMLVLDFFAGSGTVGESCLELGREFILVDNNRAALDVMAQRLAQADGLEWIGYTPAGSAPRTAGASGDSEDGLTPPFGPAYARLAAAMTPLQAQLEAGNPWNDSPFGWALRLSPDNQARLGVELAAAWCRDNGLPVEAAGRPAGSLRLGDRLLVVCFALLGPDGVYRFVIQRASGPGEVLCFGLGPAQAHGWVVDRSLLDTHGLSQPGQTSGLPVDPGQPPDWLRPYGGTLEQAFAALTKLSQRK